MQSSSQLKTNINLFYRYIKYVVVRFFKDNCFESASALTYTTLLSVVPLMAVSLFVVSGVPYFQSLWADTQQFIFIHFVPATGREVQDYLKQFITQASHLGILGVSFLVFSAMVIIFTIELTFNRIWAVRSSRGITRSFLLYWAVLTLVPILMGLSFAVSSYVWSMPIWQDTAQKLGLVNYMLIVSTFCLAWLCFALMYIFIPNCAVKYRHAFGVAFFIAILFEIAKKFFVSYVTGLNLNTMIYGAFAIIPFFLLWIYICWILILLGAVMVSSLEFYKFTAGNTSEWQFLQAYKWICILWQAQHQNKELSAYELFHSEGMMTAEQPFKQLEELEAKGWIRQTINNKYILAKDLYTLTLNDLYNDFSWRLPRAELLAAQKNDPYATNLLSEITCLDNQIKIAMAKPLASICSI